MSHAQFRRPDGGLASYGDWAQSRASAWAALPAAEQKASRTAAAAKLAASVKDQADGPAQLHLYDEIGWFGVWAPDVIEALASIKGDVEVRLNSPGGDVFDALAIYAALKERPGQVGVVVDGLAASAASFIAQAASPGKLEMTANGTMMIHDAWGICAGNAEEMAASARILEQQSENIASIYAERSGRSAAELRDLMRAETWAIGQEAVDMRLADRVRRAPAADAAPALAPAAAWQVTILAAVRNDTADGDGPGVDESPWDGNAAMAGCSSAADFRAICAGEHTAGDPDERQHWALPHHKHPGAHPNRAGVNNAAARLPQTQDLKNRSAAEAHIKAHQAAMGSDHDADDRAGLPAWIQALTAKEAAKA